ncbi:hypothetical protein BT93_B2089 [Corymbia citriodora subsp. variegata]|nr:hypothetical protein BT93_B2089 [Corymbia citriodora subsp. variegata]
MTRRPPLVIARSSFSISSTPHCRSLSPSLALALFPLSFFPRTPLLFHHPRSFEANGLPRAIEPAPPPEARSDQDQYIQDHLQYGEGDRMDGRRGRRETEGGWWFREYELRDPAPERVQFGLVAREISCLQAELMM